MNRRAIWLVALLFAACTQAGPPQASVSLPSPSTASTPFPTSATVTATASPLAAWESDVLALLRGLGIEAARLQRTTLTPDPNETLIELAILDSGGRNLGTVTVEAASGTLRLLYLSGGPTVLQEPDAARQARIFLVRAGIEVGSAEPETTWDQGSFLWRVSWPRSIHGYRVATGGPSVEIYSNGTLAGIGNPDYPAAPVPTTLIGADRAMAIVLAYLTPGNATAPSLGKPALQWDLPNAMADPAAPDLPPGTLRLVYFVTWKSATNPEQSGFFEVDAGTGWIIAGGIGS